MVAAFSCNTFVCAFVILSPTVSDITQKPLIVAGQAYWEEGISRDQADQKLKLFLSNFSDWTKLQGLNWWHLGGQNQAAMSSTMYSSLKEAKLNSKFPHI